MKKITLTNDFHQTAAKVLVDEKGQELTERQFRRLRNALCKPNCTCGVVRGKQNLPPRWVAKVTISSVYVGPAQNYVDNTLDEITNKKKPQLCVYKA